MTEATGQERIDINQATAEELAGVNGIGPVLAERIVDYRAAHEPFAAVDDLVVVQGIGPVLLAAIQDELTVGAAQGRAVARGGVADAIEWPADAPVADLGADEIADIAPEPLPESPAGGEAVPGHVAPQSGREGAGAAAPAASLPPASPPPVSGSSRGAPQGWRPASWLLVLLGGLLGAVLTLVVLLLWSGTVDFASRREVQALSQNMGVMQTNAELAWQRVDDLTQQNADLERRLAQTRRSGRPGAPVLRRRRTCVGSPRCQPRGLRRARSPGRRGAARRHLRAAPLWRRERHLAQRLPLRCPRAGHGNFGTPAQTDSPDMLAQLSPEMLFDALAIRVDGAARGTCG